ncbi:hypothetical protein BJ875DRAFT_449089 [Amylocarpus encephaloides]|uniref:Uncharacterized protein n=1 Tax=Amylocarpus encephaloides TaxID=45428 RepID=A0A9P7YTY4_9HELO|nr:hypothetical protein BJ875DRAFT_449089 [Amylocarpus encephaloides]
MTPSSLHERPSKPVSKTWLWNCAAHQPPNTSQLSTYQPSPSPLGPPSCLLAPGSRKDWGGGPRHASSFKGENPPPPPSPRKTRNTKPHEGNSNGQDRRPGLGLAYASSQSQSQIFPLFKLPTTALPPILQRALLPYPRPPPSPPFRGSLLPLDETGHSACRSGKRTYSTHENLKIPSSIFRASSLTHALTSTPRQHNTHNHQPPTTLPAIPMNPSGPPLPSKYTVPLKTACHPTSSLFVARRRFLLYPECPFRLPLPLTGLPFNPEIKTPPRHSKLLRFLFWLYILWLSICPGPLIHPEDSISEKRRVGSKRNTIESEVFLLSQFFLSNDNLRHLLAS